MCAAALIWTAPVSPAAAKTSSDPYALDRAKMPESPHHSPSIRPGDQDKMVGFDFEGPVLYHPGQLIKDHSVVFDRDTFHVFYILNERWFGHATSRDLRRWTIHEPVLQRGPDDWDAAYIWAPCVVPLEGHDGHWLMYYTGVNRYGAQRTGLAYSTNGLWGWEKAAFEMFEPFACDTAWCAWDENSYSSFRDPFFFADGTALYLAQTAQTVTGLGAVALSRADGYYDWRDDGPLYVHNKWHVLESVQVLRHRRKYHLFFTEEGIGGTSHMLSDSLCSGWDIKERWFIDGGHAAEITPVAAGDTLFSRHTAYSALSGEAVYTIRFDSLFWDGDRPLVRRDNPLGADWTILWGTAFNKQPTFGDAFAFRGEDTTEVGFEGNWWIGTAEAFNGPFFGYRPGWSQGDEPRGAIRSRRFTVTGRSMTLLVGGGDWPDSCWVALHSALDGAMLYRETGRGVETMDRRVWDLERYHGREVYLEIVDNCSAPMGHINVDSIRESPYSASMESAGGGLVSAGAQAPPPPEAAATPAPASGGGSRAEGRGAGAAREPPAAGAAVACRPNPSNPSTTISFSGCTGNTARIVVFSVAGRRVYSAEVAVSADGRGSHEWDGRGDRADRVAAGAYLAAVFDGNAMLGITKLVVLR